MKHWWNWVRRCLIWSKEASPFPRFWARFARKPHPRSLSRRCRCHLPTENPSVRIAGAIGTSVQDRIGNTEAASSEPLQTHKMAYDSHDSQLEVWGTFNLHLGKVVELSWGRNYPHWLLASLSSQQNPGPIALSNLWKSFWDWLDETIHTAKSQNRTQEKFTRHDFGWPR